MVVYAVVLVVACVAIIVAGDPVSYLAPALLWIPLIALANLTELSTLPEVDLDATLSSIAIAAAAVLYPPSAVVLFTFVGALHQRELRWEAPLVMALFNRAMFALSGGVASVAALGVYALAGGRTWQVLPATLAAVVAYDVANTILLAVMLVVRRNRSWRQALGEAANPFPRFALNAGVSAMLSLLLALLVRDIGPWSVVLIAIPVWLSHSAQASARQAQDRAEQLAARVRELEMLNRLSSQLLTVREAPAVVPIATAALAAEYHSGGATIDPEGGQDVPDDRRVPIAGATPAAIVIDADSDQPRAVLEAVAALVGLTLTRLELERELAETERARTALTAQILEEATHERSRIAMAVHDDVLPLFAAAQMQIDNVDMLLEMDDRDRATQIVEKATLGVSDGIRALRDTLEALRQSTLVPGTVTDGVRKLLADLQARTGIRATVSAPEQLPPLPFAVELLAFETVRGCMANVEKHAHATTVHVEFAVDGSRLVVLMQDDGRGFDPTAIGQRSHGVALMGQRAELARGSFDLSSTPGEGTTARLEVPTW